MSVSTNLDVRSYAAAHEVRLYEVAEKLGMSPSLFSTVYMRNEQSRATKESLKRVIREIENERGEGHEEVQTEQGKV